MWDPEHYLEYADERGRPFVELVARVGAREPTTVLDLGCGPGNLTRLLTERWPGARVAGVDSSAEMIGRARAQGDGVDYRVQDLRDWLAAAEEADQRVDVLVSHATLQWLPDHLDLLPRLLARCDWLAVQVPGNFGEPSHTIRAELAGLPAYSRHLAGVEVPASHEPADYLRVLADAGAATLDVWETTYLHVLTGPDPVFAWVSATGARPTLEALPGGLREEFAADFKARLAEAYPERDGRVVLPFRRIFAVAGTAPSTVPGTVPVAGTVPGADTVTKGDAP
jgi:trans-aconitate 2-methyltransferase